MVCDLSTSCSASGLFDHYNTTLRTLLNVHAPVVTVCVRAARTAPRMTKTVGVRRKPSSREALPTYQDRRWWKVVANSVRAPTVVFSTETQWLLHFNDRLMQRWRKGSMVETADLYVATIALKLKSLLCWWLCWFLHVEGWQDSSIYLELHNL